MTIRVRIKTAVFWIVTLIAVWIVASTIAGAIKEGITINWSFDGVQHSFHVQ